MKIVLIILLAIVNTSFAQSCMPYVLKESSKEPKTSGDFNKRGNTKYQHKDYAGAIVDYTKAIELNANEPDVYFNRGAAKAVLEDFYGAMSDFNKDLELNPKNAKSYSNRAWVKNKLKDSEGAIADFKKAILLDAKDGFSYYNLGIIKLTKNDKIGGCTDLSRAGELGFTKAYEMIKIYCK